MFVYALSPFLFTHILKVDDDCYVRPAQLLAAMQHKTVCASINSAYQDAQQQLQGLKQLQTAWEVGGWVGGGGGGVEGYGEVHAEVSVAMQQVQYVVTTLHDIRVRLGCDDDGGSKEYGACVGL